MRRITSVCVSIRDFFDRLSNFEVFTFSVIFTVCITIVIPFAVSGYIEKRYPVIQEVISPPAEEVVEFMKAYLKQEFGREVKRIYYENGNLTMDIERTLTDEEFLKLYPQG